MTRMMVQTFHFRLMKIVKINKGFFRTAGIKYGWQKDNYHIFGVGVKIRDIEEHRMLEINIEGRRFILDCGVAAKFIDKYKAVFEIGVTKLGVVSRSVLREIGGSNQSIVETIGDEQEEVSRHGKNLELF